MPTVRVYGTKSWVQLLKLNGFYWEYTDDNPANKPSLKNIETLSKIDQNISWETDAEPASEARSGTIYFKVDGVPELVGAYCKKNYHYLYMFVQSYVLFLTINEASKNVTMLDEGPYISWAGSANIIDIKDYVGKYSSHYRTGPSLDSDGKYNGPGSENNNYTSSFLGHLSVGWHIKLKNDSDYSETVGKYLGQSGFTIDGTGGEHPPYIELEYELLTPTFTNLLGVSNFSDIVDASKPITFAWTFGYDNHPDEDTTIQPYQVVYGYKQTSARFRTRPKGETAYTEYKVEGEGNQISLILSTLTATDMEYQFIVTSNGGVSSKDEEWHPFTVINPYINPKNLSPKGQIINGEAATVFSWENAGIEQFGQAAYEAQISADNGVTWQALSSANNSLSRFTLAARRLESGTYRWRVRCKNWANMWGPWSEEATFLVQRGLAPPTITSVSSIPRPTVKWTSTGQQAWQMQITDADGKVLYDSGSVYGKAQQTKVPVFLPDGQVQFSVRVANIFGTWSLWGRKSVVIQNQEGPAITIKTRKVPFGVRLEWETEGTYTRYFIYRDGIPIARCTRSPYTDYRANGRHAYFIRGVDSRDYYTDSTVAYEITLIDQAAIADYETLEWIRLDSKRGGAPTHDTEREILTNFVHYDGRRLPVAEVSEFSDVSHEISFTLYERIAEEKLHALLGRTVIYKNCYGDTVIGVLYRNSTSRNWAVDATFSIVETDCKEAVDFD